VLLSPTREALEGLAEKWPETVQAAGLDPKSEPAVVDDRLGGPRGVGERLRDLAKRHDDDDPSPSNRSSIAFLATYDDKTVLFGADALADVLAEGLRRVDDGKRVRVDVCKVPHHGSRQNVKPEWLKVVDCNMWLVSTNGTRHYHPDRRAMARLLTTGDGQSLVVNYRCPMTEEYGKFVTTNEFQSRAYYPAPTEAGIRIEVSPAPVVAAEGTRCRLVDRARGRVHSRREDSSSVANLGAALPRVRRRGRGKPVNLRFWKSSDDGWVADSPALGTEHLRPTPCGDSLRPAPPADSPAPLASTLSGGGFRATLAGVGALRLVAGIGGFANLRYVSSVSGGSIANGLLARAWPDLRARGFTVDAFDELVVEPLVDRVSSDSLKHALIRNSWRTLGAMTRTELLAAKLDEWLFGGIELRHLDPEVRWIFSAANLPTGVRFTFERDVLGDYTIGLVSTEQLDVKLALAVATSSAVPGTFAPVVLDDIHFPCATTAPRLLDGGVYDNTGLEVIDGDRYRQVFVLALNSGGLLNIGGYGKLPVVAELMRANSLLYRQSTTLRTRELVARFRMSLDTPAHEPVPAGARRGVIAALATDFDPDKTERMRAWVGSHPEHRTWKGSDLAKVPTVFDKLDRGLCRALVYRGWWLLGAALASYYPERLPADPLDAPPL
jgi:NTE family protein